MKKTIVACMVLLLALQFVAAQGTVYLSNLGQASTGSLAVGSDSWLAESFKTGNNVAGYVLNSIQLGMADDTGNPSGFTVMVYSAISGGGISPGSSFGTLKAL